MKRCRLIYRSQSTEEVPSNAQLRELAKVASERNQEDGITGLLILSGTRFLQVLEGPSDKVNATFQRICRDGRHHDIELLTFESAPDPCFDTWNMRLVDLHDLPMPSRQVFLEKYDHEDEAVVIPDSVPLALALLLDARAVCLDQAWATKSS